MGKTDSAGGAIGSLISFFTRLTFNLLQYVALLISIGVTVYTIGDCTRCIVRDKKSVLEIVYWRDPKRSAGVLAVILVALYLFANCTLLSLVAYTALVALAGAIGFRLLKLGQAQIQKTDGSNPFKHLLEQEITVPQDRLHSQVDVLVEHGQCVAKHLRRLFLVENLLDSIKFGLLLYTLTYVGAWFSAISLILLYVLAVFSVPKFYEVFKEPIDSYVNQAKEHIDRVQNQVTDKLPFLKRLTESTKKEQ